MSEENVTKVNKIKTYLDLPGNSVAQFFDYRMGCADRAT